MEAMPVRVMAVLLLAAVIAAYVVPRLQCDIPLTEISCSTDMECECLHGGPEGE